MYTKKQSFNRSEGISLAEPFFLIDGHDEGYPVRVAGYWFELNG